MKVKIRNSKVKYRKKTGFLTRKKTRGGRAAVRNQRNVAAGRPKKVKLMKARHCKRRFKQDR